MVAFVRFCLWLYLKETKVQGREYLPGEGGAILVANHLNNADPCIIPGILDRRVSAMAKKEIFRWPFVNILFRLIAAFPVDRRAADIAALREAQHVIADGNLLLMFPEGTRSRDLQLHRGFAGTAMVAYRTDAPIVPVAIWGTESIPWPWMFVRPFIGPRVTVRFGEPFRLPRRERVNSQAAREATDEIMLRIALLLPEQYRGEYREAAAAASADADRSQSTPV